MFLLGTRCRMNGGCIDTELPLLAWWGLPLMILLYLGLVWLLGNVIPLITQAFAMGLAIGAVIALGVAWTVPENPALYFLGSLLGVPIAWFGYMGQTKRIAMARGVSWMPPPQGLQ